jgi:hypothetical protein
LGAGCAKPGISNSATGGSFVSPPRSVQPLSQPIANTSSAETTKTKARQLCYPKNCLANMPLTSNVPCRFLSDKQIAASGPRRLSFVLLDVLNSTFGNHHLPIYITLSLPKFAPAVGADLAHDRLAGSRRLEQLQSAHFFPSFGLGLYDTAYSCPYTIRTSASAYFSQASPSTKLKYDATAAI